MRVRGPWRELAPGRGVGGPRRPVYPPVSVSLRRSLWTPERPRLCRAALCRGFKSGYIPPMLRRIQALNYRCLRHVDVSLGDFHVLIGPNASGKSTLFDVVAFLGDMISKGLEEAVEKRTRNFQDLVWNRPKKNLGFELALEFDIPEALQGKLPKNKNYRVFRYEVRVSEGADGLCIERERGSILPACKAGAAQRRPFPEPLKPVETILGAKIPGARTVFSKSEKGHDTIREEVSEKKPRRISIAFGPTRSTLGNLPDFPNDFPVSTHVKRVLQNQVKVIFLESAKLRQPSPPKYRRNGFVPDGSNLPWSVKTLKEDHKKDYDEWISHVQATLPDLQEIHVKEHEGDRCAYLVLHYKTGVRAPSWETSDGTLRLLALTIIPYLPNENDIYLVEEPENGIHPLALDAVHDSLSSIYRSQILIATHSLSFLDRTRVEDVLCFEKGEAGDTDIISGDAHPYVLGQGENPVKSILFSSGY